MRKPHRDLMPTLNIKNPHRDLAPTVNMRNPHRDLAATLDMRNPHRDLAPTLNMRNPHGDLAHTGTYRCCMFSGNCKSMVSFGSLCINPNVNTNSFVSVFGANVTKNAGGPKV